MKSRDWSSWLLKRIAGLALCAAALITTTASAQNPIYTPASSPTYQYLPGPRVVRAQQPKVMDLPMPEKLPAPKDEMEPILKALPAPMLEPGEEGMVISLPAALRLANAQAWDITIAVQQLQIAVAQRLGADVLWLPTLTAGVDYQYHSGPAQQVDGTTVSNTHDNLYAGGSPLAIFALTDAIFTPLSARQVVRAQDANIQTARNDILTDLAVAYFDLLQAEADLASIADVDRRTGDFVNKCEKLAPGLIPQVEIDRARAIKSNIEQIVETARQRWRTASAEVARIARLKPTVVLQPLEPPHLRVTLVPENMTPDKLVPIGLAMRPELSFFESQVRAARERERQERWRPWLPSIIARGGGTTPPYPMAFGTYGAGTGSDLSNFAQRSDWDVSAVWTLQNVGLGNFALIRQRARETDLARSQEYKFADIVAREITVAWADIRSASRRVASAERELKAADISAKGNLRALGEIHRFQGNVLGLVFRPQEVLQSLQALNSAYFDYYATIADYNRAQFRMYRALGNPAQLLEGHNGLQGPLLNQEAQKAMPAVQVQ